MLRNDCNNTFQVDVRPIVETWVERLWNAPWRAGSLLFATLVVWQRRVDDRRALARLDARLLADIGIDPVEARREARKPFWRA